jgi:peptidoglycan/xylan/chitin deacetylase (PgdA/CDA1 family)
MKQLIINFIFVIAYYAGIIRLFYFITRERQRVITYHNIIPDKYFNNSIELGVSSSSSVLNFQLQEISKKFNFTTEINERNSCIISFDDGYLNNYNIAIPILDKYKVKAVFFISHDLVLNGKSLWIDTIMKWYSYVPVGEYIVNGIESNISNLNRVKVFSEAMLALHQDYKLKDKLLSSLNTAFSFKNLPIDKCYNQLRFNPISLTQIDRMKENKHLIASHTLSHDILSLLSDKDLKSEISSSEALISDFYNTDYFAYPFGGINEVSKNVLGSYSTSQFKKCFVNYWNFNNNATDQSLQRISLPNTKNKYVIHAYLSGFYFFFKKRITHE